MFGFGKKNIAHLAADDEIDAFQAGLVDVVYTACGEPIYEEGPLDRKSPLCAACASAEGWIYVKETRTWFSPREWAELHETG